MIDSNSYAAYSRRRMVAQRTFQVQFIAQLAALILCVCVPVNDIGTRVRAGVVVLGLPWSLPVLGGYLGYTLNGGNPEASDEFFTAGLAMSVAVSVIIAVAVRTLARRALKSTQGYQFDRAPTRRRRLLARGLDMVLAYSVIFGLFHVLESVLGTSSRHAWIYVYLAFAPLLGVALIETFFLTLFGATPGKRLLKVSALSQDGGKIGLGSAACRSVLVIALGLVPYSCSLFTVLLRRRTLAAHDELSNSRLQVYR